MLLTKAQVVRGSEEEEMIFQIEHMLSFVRLSYVIWTEFRDLIQNEKVNWSVNRCALFEFKLSLLLTHT